VKAGTTVEWTNKDAVAHRIGSDSAEVASPALSGAQSTYSHLFVAPGDYPYYCAIHPSMRGTVTVAPST
jgi:plastocyanin